MKKLWKKCLSLFILAGLISSFSVGCATLDSSSVSSNAGSQTKRIRIDVMRNCGVNPPSGADDIIKAELDKALNIDIVMESGSADYQNQLNVRLAGGNAPDVFQNGSRQILVDNAKKGVLLDLTPYLEKLGKWKSMVGENNVKKGYVDNKLYALPNKTDTPYTCLWIRKDWLDHLNLKVPTTLDELVNIAKEFTFNDPDGNGKKDTYGIGGAGLGAFCDIFGGFALPLPGSTFIKDKKVTNSLFDPAMKDALSYVKNIIALGVTDPEIVSSGDPNSQKLIQGKYGIVESGWNLLYKEPYASQIKQVNAKANWVQVTPPQGPSGAANTQSYDINNAGYLFSVSSSVTKDDAKVNRIIDLFNYVASDDGGLRLVEYGVKGRDYKVEDSKIVGTDKLFSEGGWFWVYQLAGRNEKEYLRVKFPQQSTMIDFALKLPRITVYDSILDQPEGYNHTDADTYINESMIKFIYNKQPLDQYQKFLDTLQTQFNYKTFMESAEKQLKESGYVK